MTTAGETRRRTPPSLAGKRDRWSWLVIPATVFLAAFFLVLCW